MAAKEAKTPNRRQELPLRTLVVRFFRMLTFRWGWKLVCLLLSLLLWGGLISQDATLTREKRFSDVPVNVVNSDTLIRNGLIVVSGLENIGLIRMHADVPQKYYATAMPSNYNVRVDLSRVLAAGAQKVPITFTNTTNYGTVTWLSATEITVEVEPYVTRRRIPVQVETQSTPPAGFYAPPPSVDPLLVTVSGPKSVCDSVARCVAVYNLASLAPQAGTQISAVSFSLHDSEGNRINNSLLSVSYESVRLDSLVIEQTLYPMKTVDINLSGILSGVPARGYHVASVVADPSYLSVAGSTEMIQSLKLLDVDASINVDGASENEIIRQVKVLPPQGAQYISSELVYVTVYIEPVYDDAVDPK